MVKSVDKIFDTDLKAIQIAWVIQIPRQQTSDGMVWFVESLCAWTFFIDKLVTGETQLNMLRDKSMIQIKRLGDGLPD